jgi:ATP-binding cassette subfamily F protein 3
VLVVSHDRAVLRGLATQVWELRNEKLIQFPGSFVEWEQAKADRKAHEEREARERNARESERVSKARAAANASANAAARAGRDSTRNHTTLTSTARGQASTNDARGDIRKEARRLQKLLADAELRVASLESRVHQLERTLEDTTLYDSTQGIEKAQRLGKELDEARDSLEEAMHEWSAAAERFDALGVKV